MLRDNEETTEDASDDAAFVSDVQSADTLTQG